MDKKSTAITYVAATLLGTVASVTLATFWLGTSSLTLALFTGAAFSIIGVSMWENIGEAVVFSVILGVLTSGFFAFGPEIAFLKKTIIPVVTGLCIGKIVIGISREIC